MSRNKLVAIGLTAMLGGCTVGPDYREPQIHVPQRWHEMPAAGALGQATQFDAAPTATQPADLAQWWQAFADPELHRLVERAAWANLDLGIAEGRICEARAQRALIAGEGYPALESSVGYSRQQPSEHGPEARFFNGLSRFVGLSPSALGYELYQAGFDASWELDLFGRVRRNVEAANANEAAAVEGRRDLLISLEAEVARSYIEMRSAQRRLTIAQEHVTAQKATLELVRQKRSVGAVTELDVNRAAAQLSVSESHIPLWVRQTRLSMHALSVLLAEDLGTLEEELNVTVPSLKAPEALAIGLPAELLRRRPDIRRAERELAGATARIGVATADLYPRLGLKGTFGLQAIELPELGDWSSHAFGLGPWIRWPIFEGGRIRANIQVQDARRQQALAQYQRVVLKAIREVEDALIAHTTEQARRRSLANAVESSRQAVELAQLAYEAGATDLLVVLDVQRMLYAAQDALAEADQGAMMCLVGLYKAIGGGWDVAAATQP
jgi:outer membrane protein, multidrug efflux system